MLPVEKRFNQCINSNVFKCFDIQRPHYLNEVFVKVPESSLLLRNSFHKLKQPFRESDTGQIVIIIIITIIVIIVVIIITVAV